MSIKIEVWGDYACFTRPEMKAERVSYDVMTPSAAVGILEAIYWHPGLRYQINKIHVLKPIQFTNIRRNELKSVASASATLSAFRKGKPIACYASEDRQQRASLILKDVHYVIEASISLTEEAAPGDNLAKFYEILRRRARKGQCFSQPYFGCREFAAHFREWEGEDIPSIPVSRDLNFMLYSMNYSNPENIKPEFFRATLINGVMDLRNCEVFR